MVPFSIVRTKNLNAFGKKKRKILVSNKYVLNGSGTGRFSMINGQRWSYPITKQQNPATYSTTKPPVRANPCGKSVADPMFIPDPNFSIPDPGSASKNLSTLKVDGNEKLGRLRFLQLLGISLGPWRSMSFWTFFLALRNLFPFPLSPAKWIGDLFDKKRCG